MFLPHVTHWDATPAVVLDIKLMNVPVKEVKQGVLHTHQQEDLKIRRQMSTVKDTQAGRNEVDQRSVGSSNSSVRCWSCNNVGHIAAHCRMMRCYSCSGLGHKAQDCWSIRKQSLRSYLDNSSRKASTNEGTNSQRTDAKKQVWIRIPTVINEDMPNKVWIS